MERSPEYEAEAAERAVNAFFASLAKSYPECTTGDLTPWHLFGFMAHAHRAAHAWYVANRGAEVEPVPTTFPCEQGHKHRSEDAMDACDDRAAADRARAKRDAWARRVAAGTAEVSDHGA